MLRALSSFASGRRTKWVVIAIWVILAVALGPFQSKLQEATTNEPEEYLPASADSTEVADLLKDRFPEGRIVEGIVVVEREGGLTAADRQLIARRSAELARGDRLVRTLDPILPFDARGRPLGGDTARLVSRDREAATVVFPMNTDTSEEFSANVEEIRDEFGADADSGEGRRGGLEIHVTGPAGFATDAIEIFESIDVSLLAVTATLVLVLLLAIYRSPVIALVPLFVVAIAYAIAAAMVYGLIEAGVFDVNAQTTSILIVLMFGAGTDYCLLIVARYREELRKRSDVHDAMAHATERTAPAILSAGGTVVAAMCVLVLADLKSTASMGPVLALGVLVMIAAGLTLLPALLAALGRRSFWPSIPRVGEMPVKPLDIWRRVGHFVHERPVFAMAAVLGFLIAGAFGNLTNTGDLGFGEGFRKDTDSVSGQEVLDRHFDRGSAAPTQLVVDSRAARNVTAALERTEGVAQVFPGGRSRDGRLLNLDAILTADPFSDRAESIIPRIRRAAEGAVGQGQVALVGGTTAENLDTNDTLRSDAKVIVPLILLLITLILIVLVRALVAPLYLVGTVVVSFAFALGMSLLLFKHVLGMEDTDPSLPTFAFIFLVALGVDYNIFLIHRVREEADALGTKEGVIAALENTGGVITSAGLILAGTFLALATLPLEATTQIGITIALGILIDTFLVRSVLVPAIAFKLGHWNWWPAARSRRRIVAGRPA